MEKSLVTFYFPSVLRYLSIVVMLVSIYFIFQLQLLIAVVLITGGFFIFTAKYVTTINKKEKYLHDYFSFMGLRTNSKKILYTSLEKVIVNKQNKGYTANSRSRDRQVKWSQFDACLIYDEQKSFSLLSENSKSTLLTNLKDIIDFLDLPVEERTSHIPFKLKV